MMMEKKKFILKKISLICLAVIMAFAFTACDDDDDDYVVPSTEATATETQPVETQAPAVSSTDDIGYDEVKSIVLQRVPGASEDNIYDLEREYDDGMLKYERSVYYDGYEYEFEINGKTGDILQWEIDD